ncbi:MAG: polyprenyl synthetase family protein [Fimbriimonadaceae bacterium]|nr:polyprenyl synthetase family protein [Chitinophagales bacterium]
MYTYTDVKNIIEKEIQQLHLPGYPAGLYDPVKYILSIGGKRFRPCLTLLSANIFSDDISSVINPALAMEVFHNFTLMHDDIIDKAPIRRGKITVQEKWNINTAILSGDVMLVKAYELLCTADKNKLPAILDVFNRTSKEVCEGQQMDTDFEKRENVAIDEYIEMIALKTSVLLGCCTYIGAITANADAADAKCLYDFGKYLGISFQIQDDLLDAFGDETFGKKTGGDIAQHKKTFLWITLQEKLNAEEKVYFKNKILHEAENEKIKNVIALYEKYKIKKIAEAAMKKYYESSLAALEIVKAAGERKKVLHEIADAIYYRKF